MAKIKIGLSNEDKQGMANDVYDRVSGKIGEFESDVSTRLDNQDRTIAGLGQLRPTGVDTEENIIAKKADTGIWISSDTGYWYYWNENLSLYVRGGVYIQPDVDTLLIDNNITTIYQLVDYLNEHVFDFRKYQDKNIIFRSVLTEGRIFYDFNAIITTYGDSNTDYKTIIICEDGIYSLTSKLTDDGLTYQCDTVSKTKHVKIEEDIVDVNSFIKYVNESEYNLFRYDSDIIIFESVESESNWIWHTFVFVPAISPEGGTLICDGNMYRLTGTFAKYKVEKYITEIDLSNSAGVDALVPTIVEELPETGEINKLYIKKVPNTEKEAQFIYDGHTFDAPEIPSGYYLTMIGNNDAMSIHLASTDGAIQMDIDLNKYYLCCVSKNGTIFTGYSGIQRFGGEPDIGEYTTITPSTNNIKWYTIKKSDVEHSLWELVAEKVFALYRNSEPTYKINVVATTCPRGTGNFIYNMDASVDDLYFSYNSSLYTNIPIGHDYGSYQLEFINLIINAYVYEYYLMDGNFLYKLTTSSELKKTINKLKTEINTTLGDIESLLSEV